MKQNYTTNKLIPKMKTKHLLLIYLFLLTAFNLTAQTEPQQPKTTSDSISKGYNKWTIEASFGNSKGTRPYAAGYYASNFKSASADIDINSFSFGARYMINTKFGFKVALNSEELRPISKNNSLPFKMQQYGMSFQGVINVVRVLNLEKAFGRFSLLFHSGLKFDHMISKTYNKVGDDQNYNENANNYGILIGLSPQFRITNKLAAQFDFSVQNNFRQKLNWDGSSASKSNNLSGQLISASFGLNYAIGKHKTHADWATTEPEVLKIKNDSLTKRISSLEKNVEQMQVQMNDTDRDGVLDFLDQENNSVSGVKVDTKGVMIDSNKNGVPDELERNTNSTENTIDKNMAAIAKNNPELKQDEIVKSLINEGYIAVYFDVNKTTPTNISSEGIDYIKTYIKNNPSAVVTIIGHCDVTGSEQLKNKLGIERAKSVKNILLSSGINESQLKTMSEGEDESASKDSNGAKKLVRRVTFKID